jgi:hypothetical protein
MFCGMCHLDNLLKIPEEEKESRRPESGCRLTQTSEISRGGRKPPAI